MKKGEGRIRQTLLPEAYTPTFSIIRSRNEEKSKATTADFEKLPPEMKQTVNEMETEPSNSRSKSDRPKFEFKLNFGVNPFSIPSKDVSVNNDKNTSNTPAEPDKLRSLVGAKSLRRELAKRIVMRDKSVRAKRLAMIKNSRLIAVKARTEKREDMMKKLRKICTKKE